MKTTTRYTLVSLFIFIFVVFAPLLILYVSGTKLNFGSRDTSSTGLLDAKTNPTDASLLIDGKEHSKTPAIARFLNQGEYVFTLKKDGYYDWSKRLPIESGQVTFAQVGVDEIQLIKKSEPLTIVPEGVSSFTLVDNEIWFSNGNSVSYTPIDDPAKINSIPLGFTPRSIHRLRDKNHLFVSGDTVHAVVNTESYTAFQIDFSFNPNDAVIINNILLVNIGQILRSYNLISMEEVILREDVSGFTMLGNTAYIADIAGSISTAIWDGANFNDTQSILSNQLIPSGQSQLIITDQKELFFKDSSKNLYRVNQTLEPVASQVEAASLDLATNELAIRTSSELGFYNFLNSKIQLVTRSTQEVTNYFVRSNIGYGFVGTANGLEAIEIDSRDQQNRYQLLTDGKVWQLAITGNQKTIIALQDGSLVMLEIRN